LKNKYIIFEMVGTEVVRHNATRILRRKKVEKTSQLPLDELPQKWQRDRIMRFD